MIVVLDDIRSIHNVGSIFRTADAAGISKIYLCGITPGPLDRFDKAVPAFTKVSLGAEYSVPWERTVSIQPLLKSLKETGHRIVAVEQDERAIAYTAFATTAPDLDSLVLVLGNEVSGISREALEESEVILEIPMHGSKESLNVVVAFGIVAFRLIERP